MNSVLQDDQVVNSSRQHRRGPGQPSKQTPARIQGINREIVQAALAGAEIPSDERLAAAYGVSERTVRDIRLRVLGLERPELKRWAQASRTGSTLDPRGRELICTTPFAGLWLLVPQIIDSGLAQAAELLQMTERTRVLAIQIVLTLVAWAALGFQRLSHLDDYRHWADMGLALFTGHVHLWSDTTVWRWVHGVTPDSATRFYQRTAAPIVGQPASQGRFSLDEHVVPSFTKRHPRPLGQTRVPTRGRSYPAFRLYAFFDLDLGRFAGLVVSQARAVLSRLLPELLAEVRELRRQAQVPDPDSVRLIIDRGGYKGSLFEMLMADPKVSFIAMARATALNVRQWEAMPEDSFQPYQPAGVDTPNPHLRIALAVTHIRHCQYPLPSVVIRDDAPATKQRWRVLFYKNPPHQAPTAQDIDAEYRQRQHQELGFAEYVHALAGNCLPKAYEMIRVPNTQGQERTTVDTAETAASQRAVHLVAWIKFLTFNLIHDFGAALGPDQAHRQVATLVRRYILRPGRLYMDNGYLTVQLDPFRGQEALQSFIPQLNQRRLPIPWLSDLILRVEIAGQPHGLAAAPHVIRQRILANSTAASPV